MSDIEVPAADRVVTSTDNNPPEQTPLEKAKEELSLLDLEASAWFDGAPIENEKQAEDVARLLDAARKASQRFDSARKEEKEPHAKAAKAVDDSWKPVITDADRIVECAKKAQGKWLIKFDAEKRAEEERLRREAQEKIAAAQRLAAEADGSLEAAKARDAAIKEAQRAERIAAHAGTEKANAKGAGMSRAIGLRTVYSAKVVDRRLLLNHIATTEADALTEFVQDWASKSVNSGRREIPGVEVVEDRVAA